MGTPDQKYPTISMRDWIAMECLISIAESREWAITPREVARNAYSIADAMLNERKAGLKESDPVQPELGSHIGKLPRSH